MPSPLEALSPIDGRYASHVRKLAPIFSEMGLMRKRIMVEIEYLIALGEEGGVREVPPFDEKQKKALRSLYQKFTLKDAEEVKRIEKTTDHDVKAIEYFIRDRLKKPTRKGAINRAPTEIEFVHFALTSEDVNNLSYSLMWREGLNVYIQSLNKLIHIIKGVAKTNNNQPMLSLTHGQPASPTTLGKELAVFYFRLIQQRSELKRIQ